MKSRISPEIEAIYEQLVWVERRRFRILESVSAHFGKATVDRALSSKGIKSSPLQDEPELSSLLDEREPENFLRSLAFEIEKCEAETITLLRSHVSVYREHVDEQIHFGGRTAGQEAGRHFLSRTPSSQRSIALSVPESVQAVFELNFKGLPGEKNHFLVLRSQGGSSVHFARSPHLDSWRAAGADPAFLHSIRIEWIKGILDIVAPQVEFSAPFAIEKGNNFGLEHFFLKGQHAEP